MEPIEQALSNFISSENRAEYSTFLMGWRSMPKLKKEQPTNNFHFIAKLMNILHRVIQN